MEVGNLLFDYLIIEGMYNINKLRDEAYRVAVKHGWHDEEHSNKHWLCLIISELMEAMEADRKGRHSDIEKFSSELDYVTNLMKLQGENYDLAYHDLFEYHIKDSFEDELADVCIRVLDLAGLRCVDLGIYEVQMSNCSYTEFCYDVISIITNPNKSQETWLTDLLNTIISFVFSYCKLNNINIEKSISLKIGYNRTREYKHGNKKY